VNAAPRTQTGRRAESLACGFLQGHGLRLLARNYRCRCGEVDLVMSDGDTTVFVEVRYRRHAGFGSGAESVDARKRRRLTAAALHYLQRHGEAAQGPSRFDVVSMSGPPQAPGIDWIRNAFEA